MISEIIIGHSVTPVECPHYSGVAVRISFLASVEEEIYYAFKFFTVFIYNFRFSAAILANWWVVNLFWPYHLVALPYLGEVTKAFPLNPSDYGMAAERMACMKGNFIPWNIWGLTRTLTLWHCIQRVHAAWRVEQAVPYNTSALIYIDYISQSTDTVLRLHYNTIIYRYSRNLRLHYITLHISHRNHVI